MILKKIRMKHGWYNLRKALAKWVEKNIGKEWVNEALEKYDKINQGIPIGGFVETAVFIDMVERVKAEL